MSIPQIKFSDNPNGKLLLPVWQDARLPDGEKYVTGGFLEPVLRGKSLGTVQIVATKLFKYGRLTDTFSFMNCGKHAAYQASMLKRYYVHEVNEFDAETQLVHIVCKYTHMNQDVFEGLYKDFYDHLKESVLK